MSDALIAKEFAGYRIESRVGRGGMGVVYREMESHISDLDATSQRLQETFAETRAASRPA